MQDPISQNITGVQQLVGSKMNKVLSGTGANIEGPDGELEDAFTLKMSDDELILLSKKWDGRYQGYEAKISLRQKANRAYYLGRQKEGGSQVTTEGQPISANLIFEATETFLPAALSKNPEPVVWADNTEDGNKLSTSVKTMLQYHADTLALRPKLTLMTRNWTVDLLGVLKHGWDPVIEDIRTDVRDVKNFVFDPDGYVDPYGDFCGYLGERITVTAEKLCELYPKHRGYITIMVDGKLGSDVIYTQWWNDDYTFARFREKILDKNLNPHFNYPQYEQGIDMDGQPEQIDISKPNHFARPKKPFTFLSVYSFGEQPHDVTGLIEQNIPNQNRITRRTEQIDYNLSRANNSDVFSQKNFTQETAKQAAEAMKNGRPVLVPAGGPIGEAINRLTGQGIDASYFEELQNSKDDLRSIFGTQGITATQPDEDQTARGMILNQQYDNTRIGGGIGDRLEQVADNVFNWWVQLYCVYYDDKHYGTIMGRMKAVEYIQLSRGDFTKRLVVSVSPNSMKPKDEINEINMAQTLYDKGAIGPKTLLTVLDFPDPQSAAEDGVLWQVDKAAYLQINFPELYAQLAQNQQQAAMAGGTGNLPVAGAPAEGITEPDPNGGLAVPPASSDLSNVPLSTTQ